MRSNRRRNWFVKRIALGFAVAAFVAPVAEASSQQVPTGVHGHPDNRGVGSYSVFVPGVTDFPSSSAVSTSSNQIELVRVEQPRSTPSDNAFATGDQIEVVRALPRATPSDKIEIGEPQVVAAGFDWKDAGIGAGLALALVLLGVGAALASRHVGRAQTA
jgi:hypothetical protein